MFTNIYLIKDKFIRINKILINISYNQKNNITIYNKIIIYILLNIIFFNLQQKPLM